LHKAIEPFSRRISVADFGRFEHDSEGMAFAVRILWGFSHGMPY
jgi:hypothetical protein